MKKAIIIIVGILLALGVSAFIIWHKVSNAFALPQSVDFSAGRQDRQIQTMIDARRKERLDSDETDPFGDDGIVKVLFIGLDNRIGETNGHCDAIQMIEINKTRQRVTITAVPRGTYAPLPGSGHKPTDYYVSKSCEVGGLDYGVRQIERILAQKADYLIFMGFSQAMGAFRQLDLPADETMQWLRLRQGYAIGEPQRAKNHSNFIKQMMITYAPQLDSKVSIPLEYVLYTLLRTDLTFNQGLQLIDAIVQMDVSNHPERIRLLMRPPYDVRDIRYEPEHLNEYIDSMVKPIAGIIPEGAYTGETQEARQQKLLDDIDNGLDDKEFVEWAYTNYIWLQIDDEDTRDKCHFSILQSYTDTISDDDEKKRAIADYVIEMENLGKDEWALEGKELLKADPVSR